MEEQAQPRVSPRLKEDPETLVLRGRPLPAARFRRGLIAGLTGAVAATLIALSWLALEPSGFRTAVSPAESGEPGRNLGPDALANVPDSYGDVPRLGPPLPGDLGRPILERQRSLDAPRSLDGGAGETEGRSAAQAALERSEAERQAARTSAVLVRLERRADPGAATPSVETRAVGIGAVDPAPRPAAAAGQQRKIEFMTPTGGDRMGVGFDAGPGAETLSAGSIIPASLITGLDSDLPGMVVAQVSENVRDSATGRTILIPQGARLIGKYDSMISYGQRRALLVWTRIVFPDGSSIELDNVPATDSAGYSGLRDRVDSHSWQLLKGIGLATLLGVSTELSLGGSGLVRAIRESAQQNAADAGDRITASNLDIQPTIRIRPGWPVRALVAKDLVLKPWRQ